MEWTLGALPTSLFRAKSFLLDVSAGLMAEILSGGCSQLQGTMTCQVTSPPGRHKDLAPGPFLLIWDKFEDLSEQI